VAEILQSSGNDMPAMEEVAKRIVGLEEVLARYCL